MGDVITLLGHGLFQSSMTVCRMAKSMFSERKCAPVRLGWSPSLLHHYSSKRLKLSIKWIPRVVHSALSQLWRERSLVKQPWPRLRVGIGPKIRILLPVVRIVVRRDLKSL